MINRISDVSTVLPLDAAKTKVSDAPDFQNVLRDALARVENSRSIADQAVDQFITGESQDLHSTVLATQKASLDFEYLLQVRNKVVQGYQEIMRMQL
ncbi:MAG TPA: flagellar hook-basal body complex protein FliE [Bryobacteraceae bacterium]|nr:flagellar hook-basal body complex protein FliE [Bryobacteraceae bacterium]